MNSLTWMLCLVATLMADAARADELNDLIARLKRDGLAEQVRAAKELGDMREKAAIAIPELVRLLGEETPDSGPRFFVDNLHRFAAEALTKIGARAVPALIEALEKSPDPKVRQGAALALRDFGRDAKGAIPALAGALRDADETVRVLALEALARQRDTAAGELPRLSELVEKDLSQQVRVAAVAALPAIDPAGEKALPILLRALEDKSSLVRAQAATALGRLGEKAQGAVPRLVLLLGDEESGELFSFPFIKSVRAFAGQALREIGPSAIPAVIEALESSADPKVREGAAIVVRDFGLDWKEAPAALAEALDDSEAVVRTIAIEGLARHGTKTRAQLPRLAELIEADLSEPVRVAAIGALEPIDPCGDDSLGALQGALKDRSALVRSVAAMALGRLGTKAEPAVPVLMELLADDQIRAHAYSADFAGSREVCGDAAEALGRIGATAKQALPALAKLREDRSHTALTRAIAAIAIVGIVPDDADAMTGFAAALDDDELWSDCTEVLTALDELGAKAKPAAPAIRKRLHAEDSIVRWAAIRALARVEGAAALPDLVLLLKHEELSTRCDAAYEVGELGADAKAAVPALVELLSDPPNEDGDSAQGAAASALGKIGTAARSALPKLQELLKSTPTESSLHEAVSEAIQCVQGLRVPERDRD